MSRWPRRRWLVALLAVVALAAGCAPRPAFRIGHLAQQPDSALMAHVVAETLRQAGARAVVAACPDLMTCGRELQAGDIDLLPAYSGSARVFFRSREIESGDLQAVRQAIANVGLTATPSFGFQAPYVLLTRRAEAPVAGRDSIEDLVGSEVRFAVPPGHARQPGDGLFALARRYGLELAPEDVTEIAGPAERLAALFDGRVDVAVIRMPVVPEGRPITALRDPLGFYPVYESMLVIGSVPPGERDFVLDALEPLFGALTAEEVWPPMDEIVVQGRSPETLARRLLVSEGLIDTETPTVRRPEMAIAFASAESHGTLGGRAVFTVRRAFPERPLELVGVSAPMRALERGDAELALVYTSDFFRLTFSGAFEGRDPRGEAIAAIGRRPFLLLTRANGAAPPANPLTGRVGVPPSWTAAGRVGARMLALIGRAPETTGTINMLLQRLQEDRLDSAILLLDSATREALQALPPDSGLIAANLVDILVSPPFFLNETRLPESPLPGQAGPIDTFSMQVLLAGPAPQGRIGPVHGGPASAVATRSLPLPLREAETLAAAAETPELPDPVLPSFRDREVVAEQRDRGASAWVETGLIVLAVAFVSWAGWLLGQPVRTRP